MTRIVVVLAGLSGAASVLLGAFAAHGLRARLSEQHLAVFQTAVHYQQWHSLALLLVGLWLLRQPSLYLRLASAAWLLGMLLFSGSLYALVLWGLAGGPAHAAGRPLPGRRLAGREPGRLATAAWIACNVVVD